MRPRLLAAVVAPLAVAAVLATGFLLAEDDVAEEPTTPPAPTATPSPTPPVTSTTPRPSPAPTVTAAPTPTASPRPAPDRAELRQRMEALLDRPDVATAGTVAVAVRDGEGRPVLDRLSDRPLLPASTQKAVTAAAAIQTFGPRHRFVTEARGVEPVDDAGTLRGDLVLVGAGDPALATPVFGEFVYPARPRTPLETLADDLVAAGVKRVTGRVVGDARTLSGPTEPPGWKERYFWDFDARHITGLTVDAGLHVEVDLPEDEQRDVEVGDLTLTIAPDPVAEAAAQLHRLLEEREVEIAGEPTSSVTPRPAPELLGTVSSPTLSTLLRHTLQRSDNHMADTLFRTVGDAVAGDGGWIGGALGVQAALRPLGVGLAGTVLADGSGLSRENRLTAAGLADLDAAMMSGEHGPLWSSLMAVAGQEGTLRRRLVGTLADGRFRGKTGTLDDVMAVVGTVAGPDDTRYHLAIVANDVRGADRTRVRFVMDELALILAEDLHGCERSLLPPPSPTGTEPPAVPTTPPYVLQCEEPETESTPTPPVTPTDPSVSDLPAAPAPSPTVPAAGP